MVSQAAPFPRRIGPYAIHGRLGFGGMGVVYHGTSRAGERVAVKVIQPGLLDGSEYRMRFAQEVQALKTVNGPRVALLVDADAEAGPPWFAVQHVHGPAGGDGVHVGTMQRFKGLEYQRIIIAGANDGLIPRRAIRKLEVSDPARFNRERQQARSVLFVAATRAGDELVIFWSGIPSPFLPVPNPAPVPAPT